MTTNSLLSSNQALYLLQTWFSPSFPIGAYTYSHGLENAFETGLVTNLDQAVEWVSNIVRLGSGFADAIFVKEAYQAVAADDYDALSRQCEFAAAFAGTKELRLESEAQGAAFIEIIQKTEPSEALEKLIAHNGGPYPYAIIAGALAGEKRVEQSAIMTAYLHGFVSNLSSALVRIIPLGQTEGQIIIARLSPVIEETVSAAMETPLNEISSSALMVDLTSMQHETQYTRLFRS